MSSAEARDLATRIESCAPCGGIRDRPADIAADFLRTPAGAQEVQLPSWSTPFVPVIPRIGPRAGAKQLDSPGSECRDTLASFDRSQGRGPLHDDQALEDPGRMRAISFHAARLIRLSRPLPGAPGVEADRGTDASRLYSETGRAILRIPIEPPPLAGPGIARLLQLHRRGQQRRIETIKRPRPSSRAIRMARSGDGTAPS
jgi:hypothetical protein